MSRSDLRLVLGALLAVVVPAAGLHYTTSEARLTAELTAAPFAWSRVLVAHLVTALPLGFVLAAWARRVPAIAASDRRMWAVIGAGAAGLAAVASPAIGDIVTVGNFGSVPLLFLRAFLALLLVFPWCVAALDQRPAGWPEHRPGLVIGIGLAVALIPCGMYAEAVTAAKTQSASDLLARERLARARGVLTGLVELGSEQPVGKLSPPATLRDVDQRLVKLREAADRPFPTNPRPGARIDRAVLMLQLDRPAEAAAVLLPLTPDDATATMLLATAYRDSERWAESDAMFRAVLERQMPRAATDPEARAMCVAAIEGLAFNARADGRPADAERVLWYGLGNLPGAEAFFHFHLGSHYADGGRPSLALDHLRAAAQLDPGLYRSKVEDRIRTLRTHTHACLLSGNSP